MKRADPGRWVAEGVAAAAAAAVWFVGGGAGASGDVRFFAALAVALGCTAWLKARPRPRTRPKVVPSAESAPQQEAAMMRGRLLDGMGQLRRAGHGRSRYALPWYLVLGPEGAGKSALLANSGLPLITPPPGEGATRACAVVPTDEAVFIDVAGPYVARDDLGPAEQAGWATLMTELTAQRPMLPLNGILLALSPADLCLADGVERDTMAAGIRARLLAVRERCGADLPVYVLLTKLDLTPGFAEYFDRLDADQRDQAWGFTFADEAGQPPAPFSAAAYESAFARLVDDLKHRQLDLLHLESDRQRAAMVLNFPAQLAALNPPVAQVLAAVFAADPHGHPPLLRGVFLTSGRQDPLTIDRLMPDMAGHFALPPTAAPPPDLSEDDGAQGWFIARPLRETVLAEAGRVCRRSNPYRPRVLARLAATVAAVSVCAVAASGLGSAYRRDLRQLEQVPIEMNRRSLKASPDFGEEMRALAFLTQVPAALPPPLGPNRLLGDLDAMGRLGRTPARDETLLIDRAVLPRVVALLHAGLADPALPKPQLAADLEVFNILAHRIPPDAGTLTIWMDDAAQRLLPGGDSDTAAARRLLIERTVMRLLAGRPELPLDLALAADATRRLGGDR